MAKILNRPLREIIKKTFPEKIIELIIMSQKGEPNDNNEVIYFNAFRKIGRYYNKYSASKRDESSIPTAIYKSKIKNKPKEKKKNMVHK